MNWQIFDKINTFIQQFYNFFLKEVFIEIENYDDHLKARFLLKFCFFFLLFTLILLPIVLHISPIALLLLVGVIFIIILTPFLLKWRQSITNTAILLLFTSFIYVAHLHVVTGRTEGLAIFLWYVVIILSASFTLNKKWSLFYVASSLGMVLLLIGLDQANIALYPAAKFEGPARIWSIPFRIGIPLFFIYLIAKQFVADKRKAMAVTKDLLNYQKEINSFVASRKEYYNSILEEVGDIIYEINAAGKFSYINNAGVELTGYNRDEIYKMTIDDCIVETDKTKHRAIMLEQLRLGKKENYTRFRIQTKTGEVIWIGQTSKFIYDPKGNYLNSFCVARNITKELEKEAILRAAKEEAIKHNKAKDSFMAAVSHELRTPLNSVIALGYNLLDNDPRIDQKEDITTMLYSSNLLLTLINNILDFSLIENDKIPIKKEHFDLRELLTQITNSHIQLLNNEQIFIALKIDKHIPIKLIGDSSRLAQVLNNLLQNAIKFTPQGEVVLLARLSNIKDNQVKIYFEVKDTGIGIAPSNQAIIFKRFTQLDDTLSRNYSGIGVGLSVVSGILTRLNSKIHLHSELGKGATFSFEVIFDQQAPHLPTIPKITRSGLTGAKVLLVEDNRINQLVAKKLLLKWQTKIEVADNGQIALEKIKQHNYDIILMDIEMPIMNGLEATKAIRVIRGTALPIIAVTATTSKEILDNFEAYQFTDIISKPYQPTKLYQKMLLYYQGVNSTLDASFIRSGK